MIRMIPVLGYVMMCYLVLSFSNFPRWIYIEVVHHWTIEAPRFNVFQHPGVTPGQDTSLLWLSLVASWLQLETLDYLAMDKLDVETSIGLICLNQELENEWTWITPLGWLWIKLHWNWTWKIVLLPYQQKQKKHVVIVFWIPDCSKFVNATILACHLTSCCAAMEYLEVCIHPCYMSQGFA